MFRACIKNLTWSQIFKFLTIALAALLLISQLHHAFNAPIWRDDAFFGSVVKNLANGEGYSAVFFDKNYPLHFGISSGPVILLPAAVMVFIFGNKFWALGLANIFLIWSLLISIFIVSADFFGKERRWSFCFTTLLLVLIFSMQLGNHSLGDFGVETGDKLVLWHVLMGECPAALFIVLGTLFLFSPKITPKKIAIGGLMLGLGIISKNIVALAVMVVLTMFAKRIFLGHEFKKIKEKILLIAIAGFASVLPFFLFELVKIIFFGWGKYFELQLHNREFYKANVLKRDKSVSVGLAATVMLMQHFRYGVAALVLMAAYVIKISAKVSADKAAKNYFCHTAGVVLLLAFAVHWIWWIFFSIWSDRHLVVSFFYLFTGLFLLITNIEKKGWKFKAAIVFVVFVMLVGRPKTVQYLVFDGFKKNERLQEQLGVAASVQKLKSEGVKMFSCSNNFELEYLLSSSGNFKNCGELLNGVGNDRAMLVTYFYFKNRIVSINHDQYIGSIEPLPFFALEACPEVFLETKNFSLRWCGA